jgi:acetoin:2,6-dichlorophenolindophenol oxidoreductase subunit beta
MVGLALGAAMTGLRPVCDLNFEDFIMGAMDEVINQMAKIRHMTNGQISCPVVLRGSTGVARSAGPQHSQALEAWYAHTPGLLVANPSTPEDVKGLLKSALRGNDPVIFLTHKMLSRVKGFVPEGDYTVPFGQGKITREGTDVTIVSYSLMAQHALKAANELEKQGVSAEVIDLRTIVPLDMGIIIQSVKKTKRLVVAHEAYKHVGIGAEIAATIGEVVFDYLDAPIKRVGSKHAPYAFAPGLQQYITPGPKDIIDAALSIMQGVVHV